MGGQKERTFLTVFNGCCCPAGGGHLDVTAEANARANHKMWLWQWQYRQSTAITTLRLGSASLLPKLLPSFLLSGIQENVAFDGKNRSSLGRPRAATAQLLVTSIRDLVSLLPHLVISSRQLAFSSCCSVLSHYTVLLAALAFFLACPSFYTNRQP